MQVSANDSCQVVPAAQTCAYLLLFDDQLAFGHGCSIQDVVDERGQMVGGVLDGLDVVGALVSQSPGPWPQHGLRQAYEPEIVVLLLKPC